MRIVRFEAEAIKRLKVVEITPRGNVIEITGANSQGKTSVLDALFWALAGAGAIQADPINKDAESARILLDLGEFVVTRTFKREKDGPGFTTKLTVRSPEGASFPEPQRVLDRLYGVLAFDPLEFARMKPKEQFEALRRFVPDVDFEAVDRANKGDFERRAELNRRAKEAIAAAAAIGVSPGPKEPIDEAALVDEISRATTANLLPERWRHERSMAQQSLERTTREIQELEIRLSGLVQLKEGLTRMLTTELAADCEPSSVDVDALREKIAQAHTHNEKVALRRQRAELETRAAGLERDAEALTDAMKARDVAQRKAIAAATMPVEGLGFGDGYVTLAGVPFDQASDAERLRASVAIAMAQNPKLRVLRIRDGSLLDSASMQLLDQMAELNDFQMFIELVDESGQRGIVIEDGSVVSTPESREVVRGEG